MLLTTNTEHKHISQTGPRRFVVSLPESIAIKVGQQRIQRSTLAKAVYARNLAFGFDPDEDVQPDFTPIALPPVNTDRIRFGLVGDTHLCNKQEALEELHQFYEELRQWGVKHVFHTGNWVDGDRHSQEVHTWGMDNQLAYFGKNYPKVNGIVTHIIDGDDHEGWWTQDFGVYPGKTLVNQQQEYNRDDLRYLGYMERDVTFMLGGEVVTLKVIHGGGGSAKSISLASQNIIDALTPDEIPDIAAIGHYHKAHYLPNYRGCHAIQTGSFVRQTAFMRKKKLASFVGGWIVDVSRGAYGRLRVSATYLHYPSQPWEYQSSAVVVQFGAK